MKNKALSVLRYFGIVGIIAGAVFATAVFADRPTTVTICHATGNGSYNEMTPAASADVGGHAGQDHQDGADIIPPFNYEDGSFSGQNWDAEGQAIWENGCEIPGPVEVIGCMDAEANNYNPDATVDTDPTSCTYDEEPVIGCMDGEATNYNPNATEDTDPTSCIYSEDPTVGCMDIEAINYNPAATADTDPSSCVYDEEPLAICSDGIDNDEDGQTDYPADPGCSSADDTDETDPVVEPSVCTVVSDETNMVEGGDNAVETFNHPITWYDENILGSGAKWIWESFYVANSTIDTTKVFVKTFTLDSVPSSATMLISADNGFILEINGTVITDKSGVGDNFTGNQSYAISNLVAGENTIKITVTNFKQQVSTPESNPAGVLYKLSIEGGTCDDTEEPPVDVCPNLPEAQATVPQGYVLSEGMCVLDQVEEDPAICADGIDNDEDGQTDYPNDPGCSSADDTDETDPVVEPAPICSDGIDNDIDGQTDYPSDPGCSSADDTDETDPQSNGGGGRRGSGSGNRTGQVLGASTSCGLYMDQYIRLGYTNNKDQVIKLQTFLADYLKINLAIDGVYGKGTESAVRQFQAMHADEVLTPWGINAPTGIVFRTTVRKINNIMCPELNLAIPAVLIPWSRDPEMKKR